MVSDVNTARFQNLLVKNISTLKKTAQTILEILIMTHGNIENAKRTLSMTGKSSLST